MQRVPRLDAVGRIVRESSQKLRCLSAVTAQILRARLTIHRALRIMCAQRVFATRNAPSVRRMMHVTRAVEIELGSAM
jgi:hypothetical protein